MFGRFLSYSRARDSWRNLEVERPKVNLGAFARDPVYFAVAHRARAAPAGP